MVERLSNNKYKNLINVVRIGHPARILDSVLDKCLEVIIRGNQSQNDDKKLCNDIRAEIKQNIKNLEKCKNKEERYLIYTELKNLRRELKKYEHKMVTNVLKRADVILCTLCGVTRYELKAMEFDLCIIDEAAQSLEVASLIPLVKSSKIILCGDHKQLPPTIKSKDAKELSFTLFDKLYKKYPAKVCMLDTQYRMNAIICKFFSKSLYQSKLLSHSSVRDHTLLDLAYIDREKYQKKSRCLNSPFMVVDSAGVYGFEEDFVEEHVSKSNVAEAEIVCKHVNILIGVGVKYEDIAVITPYRGQVKLLKTMINNPLIEIGTVDGFQGREKEAIIISFVRSNDEHQIGFLSDDRRTNVAITRARRHCCLFLNSQTMERHKFLKNLTDFCYDSADIRTADEYLVDDLDVIDEFVDFEECQSEKPKKKVQSVKKKQAAPKLIWKKKETQKEKNDKIQMNDEQKIQNDHLQSAEIETIKTDKNKNESVVIAENVTIEIEQNENQQSAENEDLQNEVNDVQTKEDVISLIHSIDKNTKKQSKKQRKLNKDIKYKDLRNREYFEKKKKRNAELEKNKNKKKEKKYYQHRETLDKHSTKKQKDLSDVLVDANPKRCYFKGCKKKVHLIRLKCNFCARIFCMEHGAPIFHSDKCAKMQKVKIEQKKKREIKEIDKRQYNEKNNIKALKKGERNKIAKTLREKIESKQNERMRKSVRNKKKDEKKKRNKKKIPRRRK